MNTNDYVDNLFESWRKRKNEIRKKLPEIYKDANADIKTIIEMVIDAEYENAIRTDNARSMNGGSRIYTDQYKKENYEIMKMIGMVR